MLECGMNDLKSKTVVLERDSIHIPIEGLKSLARNKCSY